MIDFLYYLWSIVFSTIFALLFGVMARESLRERRLMLLTVYAFLCLIMTIGVLLTIGDLAGVIELPTEECQ